MTYDPARQVVGFSFSAMPNIYLLANDPGMPAAMTAEDMLNHADAIVGEKFAGQLERASKDFAPAPNGQGEILVLTQRRSGTAGGCR